MDELANDTMIDIILSLCVGILIGYVVYKCYIRPTKVKGPDSRDIIDKIYEIDGKFYELNPKVCGGLLF